MSFTERFLTAESDFLTAIASGPSALTRFNLQWQSLGTDFEDAISQSRIDPDEASVAYTVSSRVAILGETFMKLEEVSTEMTSDFLTRIDTALANLTLEDVSSGTTQPRPNAPYFSEPFSWLLQHLHDPYPASSLKRTWARNAQITPRSMDDWFKSLRREIGWVAFTKAHFNGSRSMAVRAASSVLLDDGDDSTVPFEAQTELLGIKTKLENLYVEERGLLTTHSTRHTSKRSRSSSTASATDVAIFPSSCSPSAFLDTSGESTNTASNSPSFRDSSRLPSLVFDQSDSEEDEKLPEPNLLIDSSIYITSLTKDDDFSQARLRRTCHSYYDLSVEESSPLWPSDPSVQLSNPLPFDPLLQPDLWSTAADNDNLGSSLELLSNDTSTIEHSTTSAPSPPPASRKRCREDEEPKALVSKKARVTCEYPRPIAPNQRNTIAPTPASISASSPEQPVVIDWERLFKEFSEVSSQNSSSCFSNLPGPIDCNVFDFDALEPLASAHGALVNTTDDLLLDKFLSTLNEPEAGSAESAPPTEDETFEELLASFTHEDSLTNPLSSGDYQRAAISIDLSPELKFGPEPSSGLSATETSSPLTHSAAQNHEPEVLPAPKTFGDVSGTRVVTRGADIPSSLALLTPFSSGGISSFDLDCLPPSFVCSPDSSENAELSIFNFPE